MRKIPFFFYFLLSVSISLAQKTQIDTTYYLGNDLVLAGEDFSIYEVCEIDKKGRKVGVCTKYNKENSPIIIANYKKGEMDGHYKRLSRLGATLIEGQYENGLKNGNWVSYDMEGNSVNFEIYEKGNEVLARKLEFVSKVTGEDPVFVLVEKQPKFPGGVQAWIEFLNDNLLYPKEAKESRIQGSVFLKFLVTKEGYILNPEVTGSPSPLLSTEALRVLTKSPKWIPAKAGGEPVDGYLEFRINFRLG